MCVCALSFHRAVITLGVLRICIVLSSHRRSKLLNVKVVLVPVPCWTWVTAAECEMLSAYIYMLYPGSKVSQ